MVGQRPQAVPPQLWYARERLQELPQNRRTAEPQEARKVWEVQQASRLLPERVGAVLCSAVGGHMPAKAVLLGIKEAR